MEGGELRRGGGGDEEGEREEMVAQGLVQYLKKKRHTQQKNVKYDREGGERKREREREREVRSVLILLFKITN